MASLATTLIPTLSANTTTADRAEPAAHFDSATAFAAIALTAVSWDGTLTMAGSRALRHSLDYRHPFKGYSDRRMVQLMNDLLTAMRQTGAQHLMVEAAAALSSEQKATAYSVANEIMRSDGILQPDEINILSNLAIVLGLSDELTSQINQVMDLLHADLTMSDQLS